MPLENEQRKLLRLQLAAPIMAQLVACNVEELEMVKMSQGRDAMKDVTRRIARNAITIAEILMEMNDERP